MGLSSLKNKVNDYKNKINDLKNLPNKSLGKDNNSTDSSSNIISIIAGSEISAVHQDNQLYDVTPGPLDTGDYNSKRKLARWAKNSSTASGASNVNEDMHTAKSISSISTLDAYYRITQVLGSQQLALSNNLYGINHQGVKGVIPENRDSFGLVFFTRPMLNLKSDNLRNVRQFYSLLTNNKYSMHAYVRDMLDPRLHRYKDGNSYGGKEEEVDINKIKQSLTMKHADIISEANVKKASAYKDNFENRTQSNQGNVADMDITSAEVRQYQNYLKWMNQYKSYETSALVDPNMAFIPLLTNTIKSMSGWPDLTLPTFTSKEGLKRDQWSIADGYIDIYEAFDIDCTFRNIKDEPTVIMFETWLRYMAMVFEGMMSPYMDMIVENEIDYNTRIYRIVLDESKTFVKKIAACGAAFPMNVPNSRYFDYDDSNKYIDSAKDINIRFKCMGAMYNDDILVHEFNQTVGIFNADLRKFVQTGTGFPKDYEEIPYNLIHYFNHRGYPLIDKDTLQLRWYISTKSDVYQELKNYYNTI